MRGDAEVKVEIKKLQEIKPKIPEYTKFGGNNWEKIDAQIRVLKEDMDEEDIDAEWGGPIEDIDTELLNSAEEAMNWVNGDPEEAPHVDWMSLVKE